MIKKTPWWQTALLAVFAAALLFGTYEAAQVGDHLQYVIQPPQQAETVGEESPAPNQPIADWMKALRDAAEEWNSTMRTWTLGGVIEETGISADDGGTAQGRVTLLGENGLELQPEYLLYGRLPYPEEITRGDAVALVDEQLALDIFRLAEPIDRAIYIDGKAYQVIGVTRHAKQVGDYTDYGAMIPLMSIIDQSIRLSALVVEADPMPGMGAGVSFRTVCSIWQGGGTVIDLGKESMAATLWLRVLLFLLGTTAVLRGVGWLNARVRRFVQDYRRHLQRRYAVQLLPGLAGACLLFLLGYAAAAALAALMMQWIIEPVYTFPEWIPAVLVEWQDIADAFWKVWQPAAVLQELRTPQLMRLRYFTLLIQGCSAAAGVLLALRYARLRAASQAVCESLAALRREGVTVSVVETEKPALFAQAGYTPCESAPVKRREKREFHAMVRIIHVQRFLQRLQPAGREGSFVLEVEDPLIPANNARWHITCAGETVRLEETSREWDLRLDVQTLTALAFGKDSFHAFMEKHADLELKRKSPAMDGMFSTQTGLPGEE